MPNKIIFGGKPIHEPDKEIALRNKRSRGRGRYGESRLAKAIDGIVVGRSKAVKLRNKWQAIDIKNPPDVLGNEGLFSYESKYLKKVPACVTKVMTQAMINAPPNFIPVGVLADRESRVTLMVITERDWVDLHVGSKKQES